MRLQAEGFDVKLCNDGESALATAIEFKPDLILLDVMMPKMSGLDVLDMLRNTPQTQYAKIVVMSALGEEDDIEKAKALGADEYLVKSQVAINDVMDTLRSLLDLPPSEISAASRIE